jgi:hypothetical protein
VTENRSLDDFLGGDAATDGESDGDDGSTDGDEPTGGDASVEDADERAENAADASVEDAADGEETDDSVDVAPAADVAPAVATYRWDPAGVACPVCSEPVDRLWLDGDEQVCADCKSW